ncbi:MAG: aminodeoxychorismate synthase component I [Phycisphaerae bacterium]
MRFSRAACPAMLESLHGPNGHARYSIFAADPAAVFVARGGAGACPLRALAAHIAKLPGLAPDPGARLPFVGGWIGFITYEAGLGVAGLAAAGGVSRADRAGVSSVAGSSYASSATHHAGPSDVSGPSGVSYVIDRINMPGVTGRGSMEGPAWPVVRFCLYDAVAVLDHDAGQWYVAAVAWPQRGARYVARRCERRHRGRGEADELALVAARPPVAARLGSVRRLLAESASLSVSPPRRPNSSAAVANMSRDAYFAKVDRALGHIAAGNIYQVNLTQRFTCTTDADPADLYRRLRVASPSSHAAYVSWGDRAVISSSPELFLDVRGGHVVTRPIKGTRPRTGEPDRDAAFRRALAESAKDRAELTMIVDLLRNDLGRVCSFGSVKVRDAGRIEAHPTVFHRVATIDGQLAAGRGWLDVLLAAFPGGSVTGAPKIRAMHIIAALEPTPRGVYCGSIGMIGLDGSMSLSIAIRTMVQAGRVVHMYAGGAIVADSTPADEYDEILAKAAGMMRALDCRVRSGRRSHRVRRDAASWLRPMGAAT